MRAAARIFGAIGIFGAVAALLLLLGSDYEVQGPVILSCFALACGFLAVLFRAQARHDLAGLPTSHDQAEEHGEIHLPGPSIYPALYAVAGTLLVLGLITHYAVAAAGGVVLVLTSLGWARESVVDYRREIAHASATTPDYPAAAVDAAYTLQSFRLAHGGADAIVQHLGQGKAEIALVGADGAWGSVAVRDVAAARTAVELAGVTVHTTWPQSVVARMQSDRDLWQRMAGHAAPHLPHGPRDGTTQVASRVFAAIGTFAVIAIALFYVGLRNKQAVQGAVILGSFSLACWFLFVMLRNARGGPEDLPFADERGIAREPTVPAPPVDLETLHLPGPSLWPAAFAIAGTVLVLGLLYSLELAIAGGVLLVLCSVGWGFESVREYRATVLGGHGHGGHHPVPDHTAGH